MQFLEHFDGSGRKPRQVQIDALRFLEQNWHKADVLAIQAPTGSGKSAIVRAVQKATGGHIVTPSNALLEQYRETYPELNIYKGMEHYKCGGYTKNVSCKYKIRDLKIAPCVGCSFVCSKERALTGDATVFNPMSLWFLTKEKDYKAPDVTIIDEAHTVLSMLMQMCGKRFSKRHYGYPDNIESEIVLRKWLELQWQLLDDRYKTCMDKGEVKRGLSLKRQAMAIDRILQSLAEAPQNMVILRETNSQGEFLNIKPLQVPRHMIEKLVGKGKLVLLSATLFKQTTVLELSGGKPDRYLDLPSPIPKQNRTIQYRPTSFPMNWETDPALIAKAIDDVIDQHPNLRTIVHVTYGMSEKIAASMRHKVLTHNQADKDAVLKRFKKDGGILLACGMAEGVDLPNDFCRLNIVPKIPFPGMADPWVAKRMTLQDGMNWFRLTALQTIMQQFGRGVRHEKDYCTNVILDPGFSALVMKNVTQLPRSFVETLDMRSAS